MSDTMTPAQRHDCMSHVRSRNTKPEKVVRDALWRKGYRYRLNDRRLPGTPDLVLPKYRAVIFINGCFWHGHDCARGARVPKNNRDYWVTKIARNVERDRKNHAALSALGWSVLILWECGIRDDASLERLLRDFLENRA